MSPFYVEIGPEAAIFEQCYGRRLALMLKGPTGCGKSRFVAHMAARLGRPLVTVPCHDDTSTADLLGRWLVRGGDTVWVDGPVTRAARQGAILYLDEVAEARPDVIVALHPLTDHRRQLYVDRHEEVIEVGPEFMVVVSFNPHYQRGLKDLKPSTRQRFVALTMGYPPAPIEAQIVAQEAGVSTTTATRLVKLAGRLRTLDVLGLAEPPSTRLLVAAARLIGAGVDARQACAAAIAEPLTDDDDILRALREVIALAF